MTQAEYYNLQSCFAGVDRADRPYDPDPHVHRARRALQQRKNELDAPPITITAMLLSPASQAEAAAWERSLAAREKAWTVLDPATFVSAGGARPAKQADRSLLFGGAAPDKDTYTIVLEPGPEPITAIRLEVLTDDALPHRGPGRQDNGNLHLSEFRAVLSPRVGAAAPKPAVIARAVADFDQTGWPAAHAIDGNPATSWGVHPEVSKPHAVVFELKEPLAAYPGGSVLTIVLEQFQGDRHLIGRPRLSVTSAPAPLGVTPVPSAIDAILRAAPTARTDAQRAELALHAMRSNVDEQLAALPPPRMVYAAASDFAPQEKFAPARGCRTVSILKRGEVSQPLGPARPGGLDCVQGLSPTFALPNPDDEAARRAALARWLSDERNVLTWRTIANRVWHYHFGRGIVDTPNDLGLMGGRPSHPELLDFLAATLLENGGSLKRLHKLIVTSATYRQASDHNPAYAAIDGGNALLWRANRARLDAESVRDAILVVSGLLDDAAAGGPSAKQFVEKPGVHVTADADYNGFDPDRPEYRRRSVYRFLFRTVPDPFMESMDCADASQLTPARSTSVTALQALSMMNNRFVVRYSEHFAARVTRARPGDLPAQVDEAYRLALARPATADERAAVAAYAAKHGMANACRLILNSNEFMFVN